MSQKVTLELPDSVMSPAAEAAERAGVPVEQVLTQWLEQMTVAQHRGVNFSDIDRVICTPFFDETGETARDLEKNTSGAKRSSC